MQKDKSIRLKAALLLIVFSMNTVVGFACAIGVDMGFNTHHHENGDEATEVSVHKHTDGKMHHHKASTHHHNKKEAKTQQLNKKKGEKEGCCNDEVLKFQKLDIQVNQNAKISFVAPVLSSYIVSFLGFNLVTPLIDQPQKCRLRFFYPPPHDILLSTRRLQI